jgi:hypothetical protein
MIINILLITSILFNVISFYVIWNTNRKLELLERYTSEFLTDLTSLQDKISEANRIMNEADRLGAFESDDEVGTAFKIIKDCIQSLETKQIDVEK